MTSDVREDENKLGLNVFQLYDHDKDGILNFKEIQKVLKCLGLRLNEDQVTIYFFWIQ